MKKTTLLLLCGLILAGCSPKLTADLVRTSAPLSPDDMLVFLDEWTPAPAGAEYYGSIVADDAGYSYGQVFSDKLMVFSMAEAKAREIGANIVDVKKHKHNDGASSNRLKADLYHLDNIDSFVYEAPVTEEHPDYAAIYFFRNSDSWPTVIYDVLIGDQKVFRSRKFSSAEVKVYEPGEVRIWAKLERTVEITLDLELGKNYYIDCGVDHGIYIGNPVFEVVPDGLGYHSYNAVKAKN